MDILLWILLKNILLSTLHGWVGASLAVFMFFRPLKPWRIGRVKIWQGVIPAQQAKIAEAISEVVAKELITPQALHDYLVLSQTLDHRVQSALHDLLGTLADAEYPTIESMFPPLASELKEELKERAKQALAGWAETFLKEPEVEDWLKSFSNRQMARLWRKKLGELWPEDWAVAFFRRLLDNMTGYASGPEFRESVHHFVERQYQLLCAQTTPLGKVLPGAIREKVDEWPAHLTRVLPELVQRLQENGELRERLTALVLDILEQLKEKGLLARLGISMFQFFREYRMEVEYFVRDDMFPRLGSFLESPEVQGWLERYVNEHSDEILSRPVGELVRELKPEQLERVKDWLAENALRWMAGGNTRDWLEEFLMERYRSAAGCTVAALLRRYSGMKPAEVEAILVGQGLDLLRQPVTLRFVRQVARSMVEEVSHYRVGRLRDHFHPQTLEKVEKAAVGVATSYLKSQIPAFLAGLDMKGIVKARIDAYSPRELVDMFQRVTMNNLQKIEIYGAVIGAVMGVFFGLANLRADAFWFIAGVLAFSIGLLRWAGRK